MALRLSHQDFWMEVLVMRTEIEHDNWWRSGESPDCDEDVSTELGRISAAQAVLTARTSQGAIAWAIALVTWPFVSVPL
jgi:hypothetical protein